ncbi:MAG TPA: adenylate/guanylate cyclase domain-containing protein [Spirochaetales bacterium]|nr:adenylate/guanylate cyclase domain-containing protein [Spirochaetales bacterium]
MYLRRVIGSGASEERITRLIEERLEADDEARERIDKRIWDLFGEEWAIVFTDLSGFSRNVEAFGIIHFLQTIYESERILVPVIDEHDGILLKMEGDSMLIIFRNPQKALRAAARMQAACVEYNRDRTDEEKVLLCVGVGYGKVLRIGDADVYGREVNSASKLGEDTAGSGDILVTQAVVDAVKADGGFSFRPLAEGPASVGAAYHYDYME